MQRRTILPTAAAAVAVALVLVLLARRPADEPAPVTQTLQTELTAPDEAPVQLAVADTPAPVDETLVIAQVRELEAMSETFRNTTFLIAIRDAGFVCNELLRVYGGLDDSGKWTATCSEMLAYTVSVASTGSLRVQPMLQYFDGVQWPTRQDFEGGDPVQIPNTRPLRDSLPPETR
jgi:hypothetical protein